MVNIYPVLAGYKQLITVFSALCLFASALVVKADQVFDSSSIPVENRSPVVMLFALSRPHYKQALGDDQWRYSAQFEISNYLSAHREQDESLFIDGETWILSQSLEFSWKGNQLGLTIPWLKHGTGKLDRAIYTFHDVLHMPQNGRTDERHDELVWRAGRNDNTLLALDEPVHRLGDIQMHLMRALDDKRWQISGLLKLPSGRFRKQSGSEAIDIGLSFSHSNPDWLAERNWLQNQALAFWWGAGLTYTGKSDKLDALEQIPLVATFRTGLAWKCAENWQVKGQIDSNSPLFDSNIRELGWIPVQASLGAQYSFSKARSFSAAIIEDLRPRVTPDVIFNLAFSTLL